MPRQTKTSLFSDRELRTLIMSAVVGSGDDGMSEDEIARFLDCCDTIRVGEGLLLLTLAGELIAVVKSGREIAFRKPTQEERRRVMSSALETDQ